MAKIAGVAHIKVNGANYSTSVEEGFSIKIQQTKAEPIVASDGTIHYSESPVADTISGTLLTTAELNPQFIADIRNGTIQIQLANGKSALLRNAIFTGDPTVESKDGKFSVEFSGNGIWL